MKNSIADLNNILFEQLDRLMDDTGDLQLEDELKRADALCQVSSKILDVGRLELEVLRVCETHQYLQEEMPDVLRDKTVHIKQIGVNAHA